MPVLNPEKIRELNDTFRKHQDASIPGKIVFTSGLLELIKEEGKAVEDVASLLREFDDFTEENDPHKEHNFGTFEFCGLKVCWKFDYYDLDLMYGSDDPSDKTKTFRVLTVFFDQ